MVEKTFKLISNHFKRIVEYFYYYSVGASRANALKYIGLKSLLQAYSQEKN